VWLMFTPDSLEPGCYNLASDGQSYPHHTAQIRRGINTEGGTPWARRDFRPTVSQGAVHPIAHSPRETPETPGPPSRVHFTPATRKPSASRVARILATWSPWISMVRSFTVPPVLHAVRSFFATFSMIETGR
jgi:hypothetical protein